MNPFLVCMVWNVTVFAGGGDVNRPLQSDSTDTSVVQSLRRNRVEVRYGEPGATFEFRHSWLTFLSTDLFVSSNSMRGAGIGVSVDPVPVLSFQAILGYPPYMDAIVDGPVFDPEYNYGFRGAFLIPLDLVQSRLYVSLSAGKVWVVDKNYDPSGGFPPARTDDVVVPTTTRKETRTLEFFEIGLGLRF